MVNVGTQESTSQSAIELAEKYPEGVYASVGFHPGHIVPTHHDEWEKEHPAEEVFDLEKLRELAKHPKVLGIGECGLDYYRATSDMGQETRKKQKEIFEAQIQLAKELKKPLIIHCREAFADLIELLVSCHMPHVANPGVIHFFSGTVDDAKALMDLGFYLGFGGVITFAESYRDIVESVPLDRIVLETDAPYVAPMPYRGKRNEPLYMEAAVAKIAEWKGTDIDIVSKITTKNARQLFNI